MTKNCWCGKIGGRVVYGGKWFYGEKSVDSQIVECETCGTWRTAWVSSTPYDYSQGTVYASGELSYRHKRSIRTIRRNLKPGSILDVGCNAGEILDHLQKTDKRLTKLVGVDQNTAALKLNQNSELHLEFGHVRTVEETFDNVICVHTLEHIPDLPEFFNHLKRRCKKGTIVYLCVPNIRSINAVRKLRCWGAFNPIQHLWHFSKGSLRRLITRLAPEFEIVEMRTSWIWPIRLPAQVFDYIPFGDQLEAVMRLR